MKKYRIGISTGDPNGVGYEIIERALAGNNVAELCTPIVFGNVKNALQCRRQLHIEDFNFQNINSASQAHPGLNNIVNCCDEITITPGSITPEGGKAAVQSLTAACQALKNGEIDALVTAPICKQNAHSEEFPFPGHTEFLQNRFGDENHKSLMILFNDYLKVALVTTHLPISEISNAITSKKVEEIVKQFNNSLKIDFGIQRPKIAVLSLNPHAGDGGLLGKEEEEKIIPAIKQCREEGILAFGPLAADGLFGSGAASQFDGIVAMYHDQGLAPFKALSGQNGVNFTAGLDIVRTSPDHGTAFDIAWQGHADKNSLLKAIYEATDILRRRKYATELKIENHIESESESESQSSKNDETECITE